MGGEEADFPPQAPEPPTLSIRVQHVGLSVDTLRIYFFLTSKFQTDGGDSLFNSHGLGLLILDYTNQVTVSDYQQGYSEFTFVK